MICDEHKSNLKIFKLKSGLVTMGKSMKKTNYSLKWHCFKKISKQYHLQKKIYFWNYLKSGKLWSRLYQNCVELWKYT